MTQSHRFNVIRTFVTAMLTMLVIQTGGAQVPDTESLNAELLLNEALLVTVDMLVNSPDGEAHLWQERVEKITIPGRAVTVGIEGGNSRLRVSLTPYPSENETLLLVARNEIWVNGEYSSSLTTLPIAYRDEVYYYPLGRAGEGSDENPVEVRMAINIIPYLETLDDDARKAIEAAFDSSTQFDLTGEGG